MGEEDDERLLKGWRNAKNSKLSGGEGGGRSMTNRERSMYNLKPHSAFKLLTMAAGYKVFCRWPGSSMERVPERDSKV